MNMNGGTRYTTKSPMSVDEWFRNTTTTRRTIALLLLISSPPIFLFILHYAIYGN